MGFLRSIFGSPKHEIWEQIAKEIGGQYVYRAFGGDILIVYFGEWKINLDTFVLPGHPISMTYTRMIARFLSKDDFYFKIYRRTFRDLIWKLFGMQDIIIGHPDFDNNFIIKSNNKQKTKLLLQDTRLRYLIDSQKDIFFIKIRKSFPEGVHELYFRYVGEIVDKSELKNLFELFSLTLERLVQIGSAYDKAPDVINR